MIAWPKKHTSWIKDRTLYISIPFTWNLPSVKQLLMQRSMLWDKVIVGGTAIELKPNYLDDMNVIVGHQLDGVLQKINPWATRTTIGCVRKCKFCGIGQGYIEPGGFKELEDWPNLPIIIDNNLLASSQKHFDRVIDRLIRWEQVDFNQGLDARLLNEYHAQRFSEIKKPIIRLALDHISYKESWVTAYEKLRNAGVAKSNIRSFALIGFNSDPQEAWERCEFIESHGVMALPMWFHPLDALEWNGITEEQRELGWDNYEQKRIMGWYYQHRGTKPMI